MNVISHGKEKFWAHQNHTLTPERLSDLVHLLRRHIVDGDDEDALELCDAMLENCFQGCLFGTVPSRRALSLSK